ncbi:MAG: UBA/TS-N domain protein [Eubacteriales bacterium]|nr:UBA/TS-N domain protein [Eubacteriales bacterium]
MDQLEKVEKLRERANVTYEEAKEALEACEWDLLDAMVHLEKAGKAKGPAQESYSTSYEEQSQYVSVKDKVQEQKDAGDSFFNKMGRLFKKFWEKCVNNSFCVKRKGEEVLKVPVWALVLAVLISWRLVLAAMVIGLFLKCQYSFCGKDDLKEANTVMEKASVLADKIKSEYDKL